MWPLHFKHTHWWERQTRSKFAPHYARGNNGACECKMDVKFMWIPTWYRMDRVSWSLALFSKNRLLKVGLIQNQETMTLQTLITVGLFYFIMRENPHESKFVEIAFNRGPSHIQLHTTLEGMWPHHMIAVVSWDGLCTLSFGLSQSHGHGHGSWLECELALILSP